MPGTRSLCLRIAPVGEAIDDGPKMVGHCCGGDLVAAHFSEATVEHTIKHRVVTASFAGHSAPHVVDDLFRSA